MNQLPTFHTHQPHTLSAKAGFTIIELMVSVGLFTIVMVLGVGAVLNANLVHKKTQSQAAVLDNLNFAMEDMARNMRLGTGFRCPIDTALNFDVPKDCPNTANNYFSVSFKGMDYVSTDVAKNRIVYQFVNRNISPSSDLGKLITSVGLDPTLIGTLKKSIDGGTTFLDLTPETVYIDLVRSGFNVYNAEIVGDGIQPYIEIRIAGIVIYKNEKTPFALETLVSQRVLDATGPTL